MEHPRSTSQVEIAQHTTPLTLGDLDEPRARHYYNKIYLPLIRDLSSVPKDPAAASELDFERLYGLLGGRIAHWRAYLEEMQSFERVIEPPIFSPYIRALSLLRRLLRSDKHGPTSWALRTTMRSLIQSPAHQLNYDALCAEVGGEEVDMMVEAGVLEYCAGPELVGEKKEWSEEWPIVRPESGVVLKAMKEIMRGEGGAEREEAEKSETGKGCEARNIQR